MTDTLEQTLADWHEKVTSLRLMKAHVTPDTLDQALSEIERAAEPFIRWLNEADAHLYSGRSVRWLRGEYARLTTRRAAKKINGKRFYLMAALPVKPNTEAILAQAERDAMADVA